MRKQKALNWFLSVICIISPDSLPAHDQDIMRIGKPGESALGNLTDKWVKNRTVDFAKLMGWKGECDHSAIGFLERKFKIPYRYSSYLAV